VLSSSLSHVSSLEMAYGLRAWAAAGPYPGTVSDVIAGDMATTRVKSFYGGEVQETSIRDAFTGRTSISRIRSESPRSRFHDPLWTRSAHWGNQAVVVPSARAPVVLEPSKMRDPLATSLHVEARNRQLYDPLDARSLYPLTGPLMRRSYLLDDPSSRRC